MKNNNFSISHFVDNKQVSKDYISQNKVKDDFIDEFLNTLQNRVQNQTGESTSTKKTSNISLSSVAEPFRSYLETRNHSK